MKKILAFSGSNSSTSINQQLINYTAKLVSNGTVEVEDIRNYPLPIFSLDLEKEGFPSNLEAFKNKIQAADAFIISSPEHNGSTPAVFKNLIDWLSRIEKKVFADKPVLLMSTSPGGRGGSSNLQLLEKQLPYQGANIVSSFSLGGFHDKMKDGVLDEEEQQKLLQAIQSFEEKL